MKYALVTGSTKGIGKQIAIDLLKRGYFVILNYANSDSEANLVREEITLISDKFSIIKANLSEFEGLDSLIKSVSEITEHIDYLVLNTAITKRCSLNEVTREDWNQVFNTNLTIPFFLVQKMAPILRENGRIIFIGALMGVVPHAISIAYGVSKSAIFPLARYLVKYFIDKAITVNVIAPGFVDTPWQLDKDPSHRKRIEEKIALKRFASVEEIASTCMHLIDNGYINGEMIMMDGGYNYK